MTYKHVVFNPGPRLNLVIGPNGAGKSTILAAIVLGLGGTPSLLDPKSPKKLQEFVRRDGDEDEAIIRITLTRDGSQAFDTDPVVERSFSRTSAKSKWKVNGKTCPAKTVAGIVKDMKIDVSNLCQFLPQFVVQDFTQASAQKLLVETQRATLGDDSLKEQEALAKLCEEADNRDATLKQLKMEAHKHTQRVESLEEGVVAYHERQKKQRRFDLCQGKVNWVQFAEIQKEGQPLSEKKKAARAAYRTARATVLPKQEAVAQAKKEVDKRAKKLKKLQAAITATDQKQKAHRKKSDKALDAHGSALNAVQDCAHAKKQNQKRLPKLEERKAQLERELEEEHPPVDEIADRLGPLKDEIRRQYRKRREITERGEDLQEEIDGLHEQLRRQHTELKQAKSQKWKKMQFLKRCGPDGKLAYNAAKHVFTIKKNSGGPSASSSSSSSSSSSASVRPFYGRVFGPVITEIDCSDPRLAHAAENSIAKRWKFAFVFTDGRDYERLRGEEGFWQRVTYVTLQERDVKSPEQVERFRPIVSRDLASLSGDGVLGFADSVLTGPPLVMEMLRSKADIHKTLLLDGGREPPLERIKSMAEQKQHASGKSGRLMGTIRCISNDTMHALKVARYGAAKAMTQVTSTRPTGILTQSEDQAQTKELQQQVHECTQRIEKLTQERTAVEKEDAPISAELKKLQQQMVDYKQQKKNRTDCEKKISKAQRMINTLKAKIASADDDVAAAKAEADVCKRKCW